MRLLLGVCVLACVACAEDPANKLGAACHADGDCAELVCGAEPAAMPEDLAVWPLTCAPAAKGGAPGNECARGGDCARGLCLLAGACAEPCARDGDCPDSQVCLPGYARASDTTLSSVMVCAARVDLPGDALVHSELRPHALTGDVDRISLPPSAAPTLYVLEHMDDHSWPVPDASSACRPPLCARSLFAADDDAHALFDLAQLPSWADGPDNPVATGDHVNPLTVLAPNGPRAPASSTGYTLEVESKQAGALRLTTLSRPARGQRLDLNLYYVGAGDWVASGSRGLPLMAAALERVDEIFAQADIYIGELRQSDVRGALLERGALLPEAEVSRGFSHLIAQYRVLPELPELFKLSAGAANVALDVFFVAEIDARGGGDVGGIAGGTPVAWGMHGGPGSGIVIAQSDFGDTGDARALGRTLAHELGHALGLFHTTEIDGAVFDPLPDTPVCPLTRDADASGTLDAHECAGLGGDNLMFPTSDTTDAQLTPQQIDVLQAALILQ
jgi:hypothetical protein